MTTRSTRFVLVMTAVVSAAAFQSVVSADDGQPTRLRAGAAAVSITPERFPLNMPGGFRANMAESVHDPFYARALVLDDRTTTLAMVVVDSLGASPEVLEEAKEIASVSARTGC